MSHKHRHTLEAIFRDPISGNLHWRDVESLLHHVGATVEPISGARFRVVHNQREFVLHHLHGSNVFSKQDVKHLRESLAGIGLTLSSYDMAKTHEH